MGKAHTHLKAQAHLRQRLRLERENSATRSFMTAWKEYEHQLLKGVANVSSDAEDSAEDEDDDSKDDEADDDTEGDDDEDEDAEEDGDIIDHTKNLTHAKLHFNPITLNLKGRKEAKVT